MIVGFAITTLVPLLMRCSHQALLSKPSHEKEGPNRATDHDDTFKVILRLWHASYNPTPIFRRWGSVNFSLKELSQSQNNLSRIMFFVVRLINNFGAELRSEMDK